MSKPLAKSCHGCLIAVCKPPATPQGAAFLLLIYRLEQSVAVKPIIACLTILCLTFAWIPSDHARTVKSHRHFSVQKKVTLVFDIPPEHHYKLVVSGGYWSDQDALVKLN